MKNKKILIFNLIVFIVLNFSFCVYGANTNINLYSEAAIIMDTETEQILYQKNIDKKMYPASTTKILTAIIAIEKCNLEDIVTATNSAISQVPSGYSSAYISDGEEMTVKDLLTVFLVHSANEAGYILAEHCSGSVEAFSNLMNEKAQEIGCKNSHFLNPSGIHNDNHYTTAYDLCLIANYCMKNNTFRNIVSMPKCTIDPTNKSLKRVYTNTNSLLNSNSQYYVENCIGIKTGYTKEAGNCLVSCFNKNNIEIICVVLGAGNIGNSDASRFIDSKNLFNYTYSNFDKKKIVNKNDVIQNIEISNATKETKNLNLIIENDITALVNLNDDIPNPTISLNDNISAPIEANTQLGTVTYHINGIEYKQNILAETTVKKDFTFLKISLIFVVFVVIFVLTIFINIKRKKKKRKLKYSSNY